MTITFVKKSWTDSIVTRLSQSVSKQSVTKTIHPLSGAETLTTSTAESVSMVFYKTDQKWFFDEEGQVEGGDAFSVTKASDELNKDDVIIVSGETYRVHDKIAYYSDDANNTKIYVYHNLFKVS